MTNETYFSSATGQSSANFGALLKSTRESIHMERKDAAAQLRLQERIIDMLESENYPTDLPATFIRGYMRSYAKFLNVPEAEISKAVDALQPKTYTPNFVPASQAPKTEPVSSSNIFMRLFTAIIVLTLVGLVGTWWHKHNATTPSVIETQQTALNLPLPITPPLAANTNVTAPESAMAEPPKADNTSSEKVATPLNTTAESTPAYVKNAAPETPASQPAATTKASDPDAGADEGDNNNENAD